MRSQDIPIPEPCHAEWDAMRPEDQGRFCFSCSKKVHDLSAMTKAEAAEVLRRAACEDLCVSFQHDEHGTVVFREPAPAPATVVPLARLRRPRSVAAMVAGAGMAAALAACAPHGEAPVRSYAVAETPVFQEPSVVIPHGTQHAVPEPPATPEPPAVEDEPCDPPVVKTEPVERTHEIPRLKGRLKRTAGKPLPPKHDDWGI